MTRLIALLLTAALTLCACANASQPAPADQAHYRIIIQFRTPVDDPANPAFVHRLAEDAGAALVYQRTLTTGAHLYRVDSPIDRAEFDALLRRLQLRRDVGYVEEDRRVPPAP